MPGASSHLATPRAALLGAAAALREQEGDSDRHFHCTLHLGEVGPLRPRLRVWAFGVL